MCSWKNCKKCQIKIVSTYPTHNRGRGLTLKQRGELHKLGLCNKCGGIERRKRGY